MGRPDEDGIQGLRKVPSKKPRFQQNPAVRELLSCLKLTGTGVDNASRYQSSFGIVRNSGGGGTTGMPTGIHAAGNPNNGVDLIKSSHTSLDFTDPHSSPSRPNEPIVNWIGISGSPENPSNCSTRNTHGRPQGSFGFSNIG